MKSARRVIVCGNHLVMSTICATLQEKPGFHVQQIEAFQPDIINKLDVAPPDVILFDLSADQPHFVIPLLRKHPTIMLIGVDLMSSEMLLLSGAQSRLLTADDLMQVMSGGGS